MFARSFQRRGVRYNKTGCTVHLLEPIILLSLFPLGSSEVVMRRMAVTMKQGVGSEGCRSRQEVPPPRGAVGEGDLAVMTP